MLLILTKLKNLIKNLFKLLNEETSCFQGRSQGIQAHTVLQGTCGKQKGNWKQESESSVTLRSSFLLETNPLQPNFLQVTVYLIRLPTLVHSK